MRDTRMTKKNAEATWRKVETDSIFEKRNLTSHCSGQLVNIIVVQAIYNIWPSIYVVHVAWCLKQCCASKGMHQQGRRNTLQTCYAWRKPFRESCCSQLMARNRALSGRDVNLWESPDLIRFWFLGVWFNSKRFWPTYPKCHYTVWRPDKPKASVVDVLGMRLNILHIAPF